MLKPGGVFITQQVGGQNNLDLAGRLIDGYHPAFPGYSLAREVANLQNAGFRVIETGEAFPMSRFGYVGAVVYLAKILEWEFPGLTVANSFERLLELQDDIEKQGYVTAQEHRFYLVAKKEYLK